jgi:hypothetical protein
MIRYSQGTRADLSLILSSEAMMMAVMRLRSTMSHRRMNETKYAYTQNEPCPTRVAMRALTAELPLISMTCMPLW